MRLRFLAALVIAVAAAACGNAPSQDQCERLMVHLIDLETVEGGGKAVTPQMKADLDKQKKAIADYTRDKFMDACTKKTSRQVVECGIGANDEKTLTQCDEAK